MEEADDRAIKRGKEVFDNICAVMDDHQWKYEKDEEKLTVAIAFSTDDLRIGLHFFLDLQSQTVKVFSMLPFEVKEEAITPMLVAACEINYLLKDGDFMYDFGHKRMFFKLTTSFKGSLISKSLLEHMLDFAYDVLDVYNDKLDAINEGKMTLGEFVEWLNQ